MDPLSTAASIIALAQAIGACWKFYSTAKDARGDIEGLRKEVASIGDLGQLVNDKLLSVSNDHVLSTSKELKDALEGCRSELEKLREKLGPEKAVKRFSFFKTQAKWPFKSPDVYKIVGNLERWKQSINLALNIDQAIQLQNVNRKLDFAGLPSAEGAAYGSFKDQHESECLTNTRVELLKFIGEWVDDPQGKCLFWLSGVAGTGKSTISRTIAGDLQRKGQLAGSFFFRRGEKDRGDSSKFFTTLACQLANYIRSIAPGIQKAIDDDPGIAYTGHGEQFNKLIFEPLSGLTDSSYLTLKPILVIDALDECDRDDDQTLIVSLLGRLKDIKTIKIRIFLTTRPEIPLRLGFDNLSGDAYRNTILHQIPGIEEDIMHFLEVEFAKIRTSHSLPPDWPGDGDTRTLAGMAVPLFIFAVTACRFIADSDPEEQIKVMMSYQSGHLASQLEKTYLPVLYQMSKNTVSRKALATDFRQIVGTIVNLTSPLPLPSLSKLLKVKEGVIKHRLGSLHSVLDVPTPTNPHAPIRTFHLSFRDFLSDENLRDHREFGDFWIDEKEAHRSIYKSCIELMSSPEGLRRNICNLNTPGILRSTIDPALIELHFSPELQYACGHWIHHLHQSGDRVKDGDSSPVYQFLRTHILHWLEAISLLGGMDKMNQIISALSSAVDITDGKSAATLIHDITRFVRQNQYIITISPLQVYWSALVFAPHKSIIKSMFDLAKVIPKATLLSRVEDEWGSLLQTLEAGSGAIHSITFSVDGRTLASAFGMRIKVWDAATGWPLWTTTADVHYTTRADVHYTWGVAFSADGTTLASGSDRGEIKLWNAVTGAPLRALAGHSDWVKRVAFSPEKGSLVLASSSSDGEVRLWDSATGALLWKVIGHTERNCEVAFSIDGKRLASGGDEIKIWDTKTGALLRTWDPFAEPERWWSRRMQFGGDGGDGILASWREDEGDNTIRIWDGATETSRLGLKCPMGYIRIVAFSAEKTMLASATQYSSTILVWNAVTGDLLRALEGHSNEIAGMTFSADGKTLASGSLDGTVKLWDMTDLTPQSNGDQVEHVTFSPDGVVLASISGTRLKMWDVATGTLLHVLQHEITYGDPRFARLATNGKIVALEYRSKVTIWDVTVGDVRVFEGPDRHNLFSLVSRQSDFLAGSLALSGDGRRLGLALVVEYPKDDIYSSLKKIYIYDTATRDLLQEQELGVSSGKIQGLALSFNGGMIASASKDRIIEVRDVDTGTLMQKFAIDYTRVALSFSEDDKCIFINGTPFSLDTAEPFSDSDLLDRYKPRKPRLYYEGDWVTYNGERFLWLPVEYRKDRSDIHDNILCLGHKSGSVSFLRFKD
ncbi:hypothetical protein H072_7129 [Dactylellina haptotyla CBS 200.50]|uniref:Nephrocystin 3-like N-terminal domain-containing protein n=1 Tax=Dactylellina haptotyla (strain CBS 200.50) TaxID=1284197 RepID=S8A7U0_DACHA|nr:hypothetical protein H072_7129 [Dactylellina haptotyla CBS 200.50]